MNSYEIAQEMTAEQRRSIQNQTISCGCDSLNPARGILNAGAISICLWLLIAGIVLAVR